MSSIFEATVRRSGNSLVITIPKPIANGLGIKNGTLTTVEVRKVDEAEEK